MNRDIRIERPRGEADLQKVHAFATEDSAAISYTMDHRATYSVEDLRQAISSGIDLRLIVVDEQPVGLVSWRPYSSERTVELGIMIQDDRLWGTGVGAIAALLAIDEIFMTFDMRKVVATTAAFNRHSVAGLTQAGFALEGVLREHFYSDGEWHAGLVFGMLRAEHAELLEQAEGTPMAYRRRISEQEMSRAQAKSSAIIAAWHAKNAAAFGHLTGNDAPELVDSAAGATR